MSTVEVRIPDFQKLSDAELGRLLEEIAAAWPDTDNHAEIILAEALRRERERNQ